MSEADSEELRQLYINKENNENNITYEEAKIILKNSVGDKADQLNAKAEILGAGLVTAIPLTIGSMGG